MAGQGGGSAAGRTRAGPQAAGLLSPPAMRPPQAIAACPGAPLRRPTLIKDQLRRPTLIKPAKSINMAAGRTRAGPQAAGPILR